GADAQAQVEAVGLVAELQQQVPEGQGVLAPGHGHQHPVGVAEHPVLADRPGDLLADVGEEAVPAEGGVVAAHLHDRLAAAALAAHGHGYVPPLIANRTSTLSPSRSLSWLVSRAPSRITSTPPATPPRRARGWATVAASATSTVRSGGRRRAVTSMTKGYPRSARPASSSDRAAGRAPWAAARHTNSPTT